MRLLPAIACLALAGCVNPYIPQTLGKPSSPAQFAKDALWCRQVAKAWRPNVALGDIAQATATGLAGAISYAPINPLIPALGAAGGGANSAAGVFDLAGTERRNVERHCLITVTDRDHSAILANPDN